MREYIKMAVDEAEKLLAKDVQWHFAGASSYSNGLWCVNLYREVPDLRSDDSRRGGEDANLRETE